MKRLLANGIAGGFMLCVIAVIGNQARGPFADKSVVRDLATGGSIVGSALAVRWAYEELGADEHEPGK